MVTTEETSPEFRVEDHRSPQTRKALFDYARNCPELAGLIIQNETTSTGELYSMLPDIASTAPGTKYALLLRMDDTLGIYPPHPDAVLSHVLLAGAAQVANSPGSI